jgi:hypothetical protein
VGEERRAENKERKEEPFCAAHSAHCSSAFETNRTMPPTILLGHVEDSASVERLARTIREWEPRLDLLVARDDPRIYEPDTTLYAVGLAIEMRLLARHKERAFRRGDLIVVPRSVAIDADEPGAS